MERNGDQVDIFPNVQALTVAAAERFAHLATNAIKEHGIKRWMLDISTSARIDKFQSEAIVR